MKEKMLMTRAARIAQPSETTVSPSGPKPSMLNVCGLNCWLIQATKSSSAPLMTKEISPKVSMYRGIAMTLMTGAITALMTPKIAPINNSVSASCQGSVPPYG